MSSPIAGYASLLAEYNFLHKNGSILSSCKGTEKKSTVKFKTTSISAEPKAEADNRLPRP